MRRGLGRRQDTLRVGSRQNPGPRGMQRGSLYYLRMPDRIGADGGRVMEKATMELLARRAGLDKALAEFPEDVAAAAEQASGAVARMKAPADPHAEPWPPMRAGGGL
jgi:hypothetical protein